MRVFSFAIILFIAFGATAQKRVKKVVLDQSIKAIQIDATNCYVIMLHTSKDNTVEVDARMDGEYSDDLELTMTETGNTLVLGAGFQPIFINPNDKLSAHKVVSIALDIVVPMWKNVEVYGTNARVVVYGDYNNLDVVLSDGTCVLNNVSQNVEVKTQSGNIVVNADKAEIIARTKYGELSNNPISGGLNRYTLHSVTGNIELHKTE